jgi:hypothetical protein
LEGKKRENEKRKALEKSNKTRAKSNKQQHLRSDDMTVECRRYRMWERDNEGVIIVEVKLYRRTVLSRVVLILCRVSLTKSHFAPLLYLLCVSFSIFAFPLVLILTLGFQSL